MNIILYLLGIIQQLYNQNCWLISFICKYIPLKQWAFEDSHSPKYQKFKEDELPKIVFRHQDWDWQDLNSYYTWKYGKPMRPVKRRSECDIPNECTCPCCKAPHSYLYRNNGKAGQLMCKVCGTLFSPEENRFSKTMTLKCLYCGHTLSRKDESFGRVLCHVLHDILKDGSRISCDSFIQKSFASYVFENVPTGSLHSDTRFFSLLGDDYIIISFFKAFVSFMQKKTPDFGKGCYVR